MVPAVDGRRPHAVDVAFLDAPRDVLAYLRAENGEHSLVILNFAATARRLDIRSILGSASTPLLLASTGGAAGRGRSAPGIGLEPFSGVVLDAGSAEIRQRGVHIAES